MLKQSNRAPQIHAFLGEQEEALWQDFWNRVDDVDALMHEDGWRLDDWVRSPRVMYKLWQLKVTIKKLNRAFGRG